jgi:hypothetical protein
MQVLEGYLLETSPVEEYLLPIRTANETKGPIPNETFDCSLHRHLGYVSDFPDMPVHI